LSDTVSRDNLIVLAGSLCHNDPKFSYAQNRWRRTNTQKGHGNPISGDGVSASFVRSLWHWDGLSRQKHYSLHIDFFCLAIT
jgi:hypothetical protein